MIINPNVCSENFNKNKNIIFYDLGFIDKSASYFSFTSKLTKAWFKTSFNVFSVKSYYCFFFTTNLMRLSFFISLTYLYRFSHKIFKCPFINIISMKCSEPRTSVRLQNNTSYTFAVYEILFNYK